MSINIYRNVSIIVVAAMLSACGDGIDVFESIPTEPTVETPPPAPTMSSFQVTVSNLTNAQPMSPGAVIIHNLDYSIFELGTPASLALEVLAEGGDNTDLLDSANSNINVITTASGLGPIPPGLSEAILLEFDETFLENAYLSLSTMLVNTNDAIAGVNSIDLAEMVVGDTIMRRGVAYDAGTEADTEQAIYIPGPAGGGEGFNADRDDNTTAVTMHSGVVTSHDGLVTSALNGQHKFDNPVIQIAIERIE